jgi:casein kinase II subunit alpha
MFQLLRALDSCHALGVMHRDVKPDNCLIDHKERKLRLIDWGLAELYFPKEPYPPYMGTLRYRAPELVIGYKYYDYAVDLWAAGITLGEMMIRYPFFEGEYAEDMVHEMSVLCGASELLTFAERYGVEVSDGFLNAMPEFSYAGWPEVYEKWRPEMRDDEGWDLLQKLLTVDPAKRITAREASVHC